MAVMVASASILTFAACAEENVGTQGGTEAPGNIMSTTTVPCIQETTVCSDCTTTYLPYTSTDPEIPNVIMQVDILSAGTVYAPYSEMVYITDGLLNGDGYLMFMSVSSRLKEIEDQIPEVPLNDVTAIRIDAPEHVGVRFDGTVDVYDENYELLAEDLTLAEVYEKGTNGWQTSKAYLFFRVTGSVKNVGDYQKVTCNAYFFEVLFAPPEHYPVPHA